MFDTRYVTVDTGRKNPVHSVLPRASANAAQSYLQNSVTTADPRKQILLVYDRAIAGCRQRDLDMAGRAVTELINGLNMDAGPIAGSLLAIYQYCGELARKGQYEEVASMLQDLRDTWAAVVGNTSSP